VFEDEMIICVENPIVSTKQQKTLLELVSESNRVTGHRLMYRNQFYSTDWQQEGIGKIQIKNNIYVNIKNMKYLRIT